MLDILKLYQDLHIPFRDKGHKHCRQGWVQVECPFCYGNPGYHLGYCIDSKSQFAGKFICWRCGGKKTLDVLSNLLNMDKGQIRSVISIYYVGPSGAFSYQQPKSKPRRGKILRDVELPTNTKPIEKVLGARKYLESRRFDPKELEHTWGIMATGPGALVKVENQVIDYSYRIIVPVMYQGKRVSFQARDWTGKSKRKYLACPKPIESLHHKDMLYGMDKCEGMDSVVLVEGVTDVWRIGTGALACFGIKYRLPQVRMLFENFQKVIVAFDPDPQAKEQARRIITELKHWKMKVDKVELPKGKDPADLTLEEWKGLRNENNY